MADCKLFNIALRISEVFDGSNIQFVFNVSGYKCLYTHPFTAERKELFPYSTVKVQTSVLNLNTLFSMDDEFCSKTSNKQNPNEFFSFSYLTFQDLYCRSVCQVQMYDLRMPHSYCVDYILLIWSPSLVLQKQIHFINELYIC